MVKEDVIAKVKKLLKLSESDNEHEANLALQKASQLMRDHCISEAQVQGEDKERLESIDFDDIHFPSNTKNWSQSLSAGVAKAFGCKPIFIGSGSSFNTKYLMRTFGTATDRATVQVMLDYSYATVNRLIKKEQKRLKTEEPWENVKKYSHNFRVGLAVSMRSTLTEIAKQNTKEVVDKTEYGIILYDKSKRVEALFKEKYPNKLKSLGSLSTRGSANGYNAGRDSGKSVQFNRPVGGQNPKGYLKS